MLQKKNVYTLIKKDVPEMKGKHIISDAGVGGEKLVYKRVTYPVKVRTFFNRWKIIIPLVLYRKIRGGIALDIETSTVIFLRPYKKNWAVKKDKEPFHKWGKKEYPFTNIWVELEFDYTDITKVIPIIKTQIEDHSLIKLLREHEEKFTIIN